MQGIAEIFLQNPMATAFGAVGLLCQLTWPLFRSHKSILTVQFGIGADYSVHYAMLDAWAGAGVAALGATQTVMAIVFGERAWFRHIGLAFLPIAAVIGFATWSGIASLFALIAVSVTMIGRMQKDTLRLRIMLLAAAPFGIAYDILVGAPAVVGGFVSAAIATSMLIREIRQRRPEFTMNAIPSPA